MAEGGEASCRSGSELVFDFFCELCIDDNKHVEAEGYCVDCREYLCVGCYSGHRRSRPTRDHVLQDKSKMPKDTPLSTDRVSKYVTTKCKVHSDKTVEYYCTSHAVLGCANCFATDHRKCGSVESVTQKSENILKSKWYKDFVWKLQMIQNKSLDLEARARENKTVSQRCYTDVVAMVRKLKEEVIVILNEIEKDIVTLAEKMISEDEEKLESVAEGCKMLSQKIENLSSEFQVLQSSKRVCQLYINMKETEGDVETLHENLGKLEEANVVRTFTLEPNAELTSLLRNSGVLGTITNQLQQVTTPQPLTTIDTSRITAAKRLTDIRIRSSSDTSDCCITGSVVVSNNRLLIADSNNNKVKMVDTNTNEIISELKLPSKPLDITSFNETQAAVTLPGITKVLFMKVSPLLTQDREINVRGAYRGIAYLNKDQLLVTVKKNPRLEIINLHGNVIRTIEHDIDGNTLFACPGYVCVSRDGETIYVSDRDRATVTSLTRDGVVKAVYKDEELYCPGKLCTDHLENVYVCGIKSKKVHMITANCRTYTVILTQADGLDSYVWSVSHCQDTNRLFMGMAENVVKVFQLS